MVNNNCCCDKVQKIGLISVVRLEETAVSDVDGWGFYMKSNGVLLFCKFTAAKML